MLSMLVQGDGDIVLSAQRSSTPHIVIAVNVGAKW